MNYRNVLLAAIAVSAALLAGPASAQRSKTVDGLVIHMGIANSLMAEHVDSQHGAHKGAHEKGTEHVVISLADGKSGVRIGNAQVVIELTDPKGRIQKKTLMGMITSGVPDYSEVFYLGWSGKYSLHVTVTPQGAARPGLRWNFRV